MSPSIPADLYIAELKAQRETFADSTALVGARCRQLEAENEALRLELEALKAKDAPR